MLYRRTPADVGFLHLSGGTLRRANPAVLLVTFKQSYFFYSPVQETAFCPAKHQLLHLQSELVAIHYRPEVGTEKGCHQIPRRNNRARRLDSHLDLVAVNGSVAQISLRPSFPFPGTGSSHALSLRRSEGRKAVQDRSPDLQFGYLSVEVARHHSLAQ